MEHGWALTSCLFKSSLSRSNCSVLSLCKSCCRTTSSWFSIIYPVMVHISKSWGSSEQLYITWLHSLYTLSLISLIARSVSFKVIFSLHHTKRTNGGKAHLICTQSTQRDKADINTLKEEICTYVGDSKQKNSRMIGANNKGPQYYTYLSKLHTCTYKITTSI